ncbi:MAG TPA: hypothetical protein PKM40_06835 [Bacteroidia bacterium]|jgi:hypothetical protein|nr:hypothetical protein [Bacteroidia bacterium]HMW09668.1 hypothetical protein [Bacteroidia bacterium]HMX97398.1 hypothetical protein [Bacteroidia bacterium]HMY13885.1 hypothetical protein [Bacteroidia bacterium]HMY64029.1 hypothetical protein [Bacteroidia bacterium]
MSKQPPKIDHEIIREKTLDRILFILEIVLVITLIALCGAIITSL